MTFTYDPTSPRGQVRLLLTDIDEATAVFTDDEIDAFLALEGENVKRAAAQAIDTNADNEALASKVIKDHQLSTDGAKVAAELHKRAATLRAQADRDDANNDDEAYFEIVRTNGPGCGPELTGNPAWWL